MGALLSYSVKSGKAIVFEEVSAASLSVANGDGSRREISKSKLMDVINPKENEKHSVKTFQILPSILLLWFEH